MQTELKINHIYIDGFDRKIFIYNSIAWDGVIFYVGRYIDDTTRKISKNIEKNAECKFLINGSHYLYFDKGWDIIKEANAN